MISARDMSKSQSKSHSVTPASTVISFPLILYVRPDTTGTRSLAPDTQYGDIKLGKDDEKPLCVRASCWYPSRDRL